jgi:hypothetical protein
MIQALLILVTLYLIAALIAILTTAVLIFAYRVSAWRVFDESGDSL